MLSKTSDAPCEDMLKNTEPAAVETVNPRSQSALFFVCDHASNRLPSCLGNLGLSRPDLESHIGWDIGAADLARRLAATFDAPLVLSGYSRLVIDCNRPLVSEGSIPLSSAGIDIPGNHNLSVDEIAARRETFFRPYHGAIATLLDRRREERQPTALISIHSFTPDYPGQQRPWHIDFGYNRDRRLAGLLLETEIDSDLVVGDNLPYKVEDDSDYGIPQHGEKRGLPHVLVEIRQDTLSTDAAVDRWADRFKKVLTRLMPNIARLAASPLPSKDHR
jgi:predicted N-formylglutamate amidohydrolase